MSKIFGNAFVCQWWANVETWSLKTFSMLRKKTFWKRFPCWVLSTFFLLTIRLCKEHQSHNMILLCLKYLQVWSVDTSHAYTVWWRHRDVTKLKCNALQPKDIACPNDLRSLPYLSSYCNWYYYTIGTQKWTITPIDEYKYLVQALYWINLELIAKKGFFADSTPRGTPEHHIQNALKYTSGKLLKIVVLKHRVS